MIRQRIALLAGCVLITTAATAGASSLINGAKIKRHSIPLSALSISAQDALQGASGDPGPQGPQGPPGPQGTPGILGVITVNGVQQSYPPGTYGAPPNAQCPAGTTVVGTGFNGPLSDVGGFVQKYGTFVGGFFANDTNITVSGNVQAICAQLPPGAAATRAAHAEDLQRFRDDVAAATERMRNGQ